MRTTSVTKIVLAFALAAASLSPALAANRYMHPRPCANPQLRCFANCDKQHWCRVYACSANQTIMLPVPCNDKTGFCFAPHC
jgi:hypothetical protein